jgi:hypothetical protein
MRIKRELRTASPMMKRELRIVSTTTVIALRDERSTMKKAENVDMTTESRRRMRRAERIVDMTNELRKRMKRVGRTVDTITTDRIGYRLNPLARKRCKMRPSGAR